MNSELNSWIEQRRKSILNKQDKVLFDEVAGCLENQHLRAAYILCWIGIIESIKRKVYEFANIGNKLAGDAIQKIEKGESQQNSVDKLIFDFAGKCGIIDQSNINTIQYLWGQRCLFAHPYEKKPSIEEVKFIIDKAVEITLGAELKFNKDYLHEICSNIVEKHYYLPIDIPGIRDFAKNILSRTPKKLFPFLFKTLLAKIGEIANEGFKTNEIVKLRFFIVEVFLNTQLNLNDPNWGVEDRATKYPFESFLGYVHSETWEKIPDRPKEMLFSYFENEADYRKFNRLKVILANMVVRKSLGEPFLSRYISKLDKIDTLSAIDFYKLQEPTYQRIKSCIETYDYNAQGEIIDYLKTPKSLETINSFDEAKQFYLGRLLASAAENEHWKSKSMVKSIMSKSYGYSDFVRSGLAIEDILSISNKLTMDWKKLLLLITQLNTLDPAASNLAYRTLLSFLNDNHSDGWEKRSFSLDKLSSLIEQAHETIEWKNDNQELFTSLTNAIKKYYSKSN